MKPIALTLLALAIFKAHPGLAAEESMDAALVRINQSVQMGPLKVTPIAVLKDQRCIEDPVRSCPIVSDAIVRLLVEQDDKIAWLDVHLGRMQRWGEHGIAIAAIRPERHNSAPIPTAAYQISIRRIPAEVRLFD